jgi:hypothetical protein
MEPTVHNEHRFSDLSPSELTTIEGGGFAYDAGRFFRHMVQLAGGPGGYASFVADIVVLDIINN